MQQWKKFKQAINSSKMQRKPSEPSPSTKAEDLLAFRTITTMLSFIQSTTGQLRRTANTMTPLGTDREDRRLLRILDALSTVLVREHEVIAVVVKPYDGSDVQVLASMVQPSNEPLLQPSNESLLQSGANSDSQSFLRRVLSNFTFAMNTHHNPIYKNNDSLLNSSPLPRIGDYEDKVPEDLTAAVKSGVKVSDSVLRAYLDAYW